MTTLQGEHCNRIKKELDNPPDDLFIELQQEAYGMMLFELFPRFWEAVKTQDKQGGRAKRSQLIQHLVRGFGREGSLVDDLCCKHPTPVASCHHRVHHREGASAYLITKAEDCLKGRIVA